MNPEGELDLLVEMKRNWMSPRLLVHEKPLRRTLKEIPRKSSDDPNHTSQRVVFEGIVETLA